MVWAIRYLKTRFGDDAVKYLVGYTDGCPNQYKSRRNAVMVGTLCDEEGLEEYLHHFAPTASFKTIVDAFGSDTKDVRHSDAPMPKKSSCNAVTCHHLDLYLTVTVNWNPVMRGYKFT